MLDVLKKNFIMQWEWFRTAWWRFVLFYKQVFIFYLSLSAAMEWDSESVKSEDVFKQPANPELEMKAAPSTPQSNGGVRLHEFVSKTVRMTLMWKNSTDWM